MSISYCAWCLSAEEIAQQQEQGDASHSICEEHEELLLINHYLGKFESVPSYVERFKNDPETSK